MEKKVHKQGAKESEVEESVQFCRQSMAIEMKRSPLRKYSVLFLLLLVISFGSTVSRLRNFVLPSIRRRSNTDREAALLPQRRVTDETFWCDRSDNRTDICHLRGDVHVVPGNSTSLVLYSAIDKTWHGEEKIWPYARKGDELTLKTVKLVMLKSIVQTPQSSLTDRSAVCDVVHPRPLLVFSAGGFTGNAFHDFNDVIIPVYLSSRAYGGEVVFGITDGREWWIKKFGAFFRQLSNHKIVDLNTADQIYCFPEATVGLRLHAELRIFPSLTDSNETMKDFQRVIHQAFGEHDTGPSFESNISRSTRLVDSGHSRGSRCQKKLIIFARNNSRVILNQDQVVKLARRVGFEVEILEPSGETPMKRLYRALHTADVMMGVHGAALAHILFMRPRSVFIQIVPLGTDWPARTCYQEPAETMLDLQYLEYHTSPDESSLIHTYGADHPAVTDPETVIGENWEVRKKMYLESQDVRLSLPKLKLTLVEAKKLAAEAFPNEDKRCH